MVFFRNIFGLVMIAPWIVKHWPKSIEVSNFRLVLIRSLSGLLNLCFIFLAIKQISLVNTTLLNNSAPFFVPIILWLWLKIPINHKLWPAIVIGFIGIALILQPDGRIFNTGAMYALLSGICTAVSLITMRLNAKKEDLYSFLLYFFLIGFVLTLPFAILNWSVQGLLPLLALIGIGVFSALGQVFLFSGLRHAKAHQLAPFTYSVVIFSGFYEFLFWGKIPPIIAYVGMALIIGSGIWIYLISRTPKNP